MALSFLKNERRMDFIRADKLYKKEQAKERRERGTAVRKYLKFSILILFFALGFAVATLLFYRASINFPQTQISTGDAELVPLVDRNYFPPVLEEINSASERIDMAMFEFKFYENEENKVRLLADALIGARARGVQVRILLDKSDWNPSIEKDNKKMIEYLKNGAIDAKFDSGKKTLHVKLIIIDDAVIIGSTNLGFSALERNNEASVLIRNKESAEYYRAYFEELWN